MTYRMGQVPLSAGSLRIMIVEKHVLTGMALANMVESLGHEVVGYTARAPKALHLAQTGWLDIAIMALDFAESITPVAETLAARNIPFILSAQYDHPPVLPIWQGRPLLRRPYQEAALAALLDEVRGWRSDDTLETRIRA